MPPVERIPAFHSNCFCTSCTGLHLCTKTVFVNSLLLLNTHCCTYKANFSFSFHRFSSSGLAGELPLPLQPTRKFTRQEQQKTVRLNKPTTDINSPIPVAERSKACVCSRSPAEIAGSNPAGGLDICLLCVCQVEVSARGWSLIQRSPIDCGVSLCVISKPQDWRG